MSHHIKLDFVYRFILYFIMIFSCGATLGNEISAPPVQVIKLYNSYPAPKEGGEVSILDVKTGVIPALIRISIGPALTDEDVWSIIFKAPGELPVKIDSENFKSNTIYDRVIQIPIGSPGKITAEFSSNAPNVYPKEILRLPSDSKPLFQMGPLNLTKLSGYSNCSEHQHPTTEENIACALTLIRHDYPGGWEYGTGIQVAPDYVLTALHVVADENGDLNGSVRVIFGPPQECTVEPKNCVLTNSIEIKGPSASEDSFPLDYALLKISTPEAFRRYVVPITSKSVLKQAKAKKGIICSGIDFDTYIVDGEENSGKISAEKYISNDKECKFCEWSSEPLSNPTSCGSGNFRHRCDTKTVNSGGSIFLRGTAKFVALHFKGLIGADPEGDDLGRGNCGIPLTRVIEDIDKQDKSIKKKIIEN